MVGIECYWWKFWRRLRALTEQLPRPVALAGAFEVPTGGTALKCNRFCARMRRKAATWLQEEEYSKFVKGSPFKYSEFGMGLH
jgi:hypothetical protein